MFGLMRFEQVDGFAAVARLRDDLELGPGAGEQAHQRLAQQRLVVGDERGHARHESASRRGMLISAHTPCGAISVNVSCASPPNASFNRSRSVDSPVPSPRLWSSGPRRCPSRA